MTVDDVEVEKRVRVGLGTQVAMDVGLADRVRDGRQRSSGSA